MMLVAPRFIAVDDKKEHLDAIVSSLQRMGAPCVGVKFDVATGLDTTHFRGVRCLFMDLHLTGGHLATDHRADFARIQGILEDCIDPRGGPFILVMWTQHPHLKEDLIAYLERFLDPKLPHARPLTVLSLAKEEFLRDLESGDIKDSRALLEAIEISVLGNPQLAVLLQWEADVLKAAGATLASLLELVPSEKRTASDYSGAIDVVLSRLVRETVGSNHVAANPRAAITTALAPILSDRVQNQDVTPAEEATWERAVTRHTVAGTEYASPLEAGSINRMLHLAVQGTERLLATDWGAVVEWPFPWDNETLRSYSGLTIKEMACREFKLRSSAIPSCKPVLVRVGAACDYAQNNPGPITYLFGLEIPESADRQMSGATPVKASDAIWASPVFYRADSPGPSRLHVHIRFPQTHLPETTAGWVVSCRLREQLLMHLINAASSHVARPGIVQIFA
jgi:hypothetical protein